VILLVATEVNNALERASWRGSLLGGEGGGASVGEWGVIFNERGVRLGEPAGVGPTE
jgi:hypothetical protein